MKDSKINKLFKMCAKNEIGIIISNTPDAIFTVDMGIKFMDKYLKCNK